MSQDAPGSAMTRTASWLMKALVFVGLAACCLAAERLATRSMSEPTPISLPPIEVEPASLDFGEAWQQAGFRWEIMFKNVSSVPCVVHDFRAGCLCTRLDSKKLSLRPGAHATEGLAMDLGDMRKNDLSPTRLVATAIYARVGSGRADDPEYHWVLEGRVRRGLTWDPLPRARSPELVCGETSEPLVFHLHPATPVKHLRLNSSPAGWKADLQRGGSAQDDYILHATARKEKPGAFSDVFAINVSDENGHALATVGIPVQGFVVQSVQVLPKPLDLGVQRVGATVSARLWLCATGHKQIEVERVIPADSLTEVMSCKRIHGQWCFDLCRPVNVPGPGVGSGVVQINQGGKRMALRYELRWYGVK
jgi:hypothetical protein